MERNDLNDLNAFAAVVRERSFTRAATRLGFSPSALSHAVKLLEARLDVRLLHRTTRSVSPTEAGERLIRTLGPALNDIESALADLLSLRSKPAGRIRVTAVKHAVSTVLIPMLPAFLEAHPDIRVEVTADDALTDIVAGGFDAGIRLGERVDKDMVAVRVSSEIPTAVVAAPSYFRRRPPPATPRDLAGHDCIGHRMGSGGLHAWPFQEAGRPFAVKVEGATIFNDGDLILDAALAGQGVAYLFADVVAPFVADGSLVQVLDGWSTAWPGYFFYYANRRHQAPALAALIEEVRARSTKLQTGEPLMVG